MQRRKTILAIFYVIPSILSPFKTYRRGGFAFFSEIYCVYEANNPVNHAGTYPVSLAVLSRIYLPEFLRTFSTSSYTFDTYFDVHRSGWA